MQYACRKLGAPVIASLSKGKSRRRRKGEGACMLRDEAKSGLSSHCRLSLPEAFLRKPDQRSSKLQKAFFASIDFLYKEQAFNPWDGALGVFDFCILQQEPLQPVAHSEFYFALKSGKISATCSGCNYFEDTKCVTSMTPVSRNNC